MRSSNTLGKRIRVILAVLAVGAAAVGVNALTAPDASAENNGLSRTPAMGWSSWSFVRRDPVD